MERIIWVLCETHELIDEVNEMRLCYFRPSINYSYIILMGYSGVISDMFCVSIFYNVIGIYVCGQLWYQFTCLWRF